MPSPRSDVLTIDGPALRRLRLEAGLSQVGLAELAGGDPVPEGPGPDPVGAARRASRLHAVTICNLERHAWRRTSARTAHRIANGLSKALERTVEVGEFTLQPSHDQESGAPVGIAS